MGNTINKQTLNVHDNDNKTDKTDKTEIKHYEDIIDLCKDKIHKLKNVKYQ